MLILADMVAQLQQSPPPNLPNQVVKEMWIFGRRERWIGVVVMKVWVVLL